MTAAVLTRALSKRYGDIALDGLELTVAPGEVYGFSAQRRRQDDDDPPAARAASRQLGSRGAVRDRRLARPGRRPPPRGVRPRRDVPVAGPDGRRDVRVLAKLRGGVDIAYRNAADRALRPGVDKKIRALSKGNRQKVALVAALSTRADLLLLDEPTTGLDPLMEKAFRESIVEARERGQAVFLSSHILSEVEALCDRVGILRGGRLVDEGTLAQLRHLTAHTVEVTFEGHAAARGRRPASRRWPSATARCATR